MARYSSFSRRETTVAKLHMRSTWFDGHASSASLLVRNQRISGLDQISEMWGEWENWFVEVEESHTSFSTPPPSVTPPSTCPEPYDIVLLQLAAFIDAPSAPWVSDRTVP
jgi:hypothetical protein